MDNKTADLKSLVASQQKQLDRYETRLKDVVAAYKGLLKEKEALEASFSALSGPTKTNSNYDQEGTSGLNNTKTAIALPMDVSSSHQAPDEHGQQIATLMNSLATLSAEKSRMEASFQADKRQLRQELHSKDNHIKELIEKVKSAASANDLEVEKVKSKLIIERHARDKEINDHMAMVRELQKLLADERHLKDHLEMQLTDLKAQFTQLDGPDARIADLRLEIDQIKRKYKDLKNSIRNNTTSSSGKGKSLDVHVAQLQSELNQMKQQHSKTIRNEQMRAQQAEERSQTLAAAHEDRVFTLESRLTELSASIGTYDRLRQSDQESIFRLKQQIALLESNGPPDRTTQSNSLANKLDEKKELNELIDELTEIKKQVIIENAKQLTPRDLTKLFSIGNDHEECSEKHDKLRQEFDRYREESDSLHEVVETQKNHIKTLQDKIHVLNRNIDEQEQELKIKSSTHLTEIKAERVKWKEIIAAMEVDFRAKVSELEIQLQKQRERSLKLLEEKELEIKTLKSSFELYPSTENELADGVTSQDPRRKISAPHQLVAYSGNHLSGTNKNNSSDCHIIHYVHELSRKEVEITTLRKAKNLAESSLRQALQDKVTTQQELHDRIGDLEDNVDRLERCKSRENANLEYLKNVVLSFLVANNLESKRHMINAIGAVLEFSPAELNTIGNYLAGRK